MGVMGWYSDALLRVYLHTISIVNTHTPFYR